MALKQLALLFTLASLCLAVPVWEDQSMRKRDVGECDHDVIETMASFGVETSKLECFTRQRVRRSCCGADCVWMAMELGVEPSSLMCPP